MFELYLPSLLMEHEVWGFVISSLLQSLWLGSKPLGGVDLAKVRVDWCCLVVTPCLF